MAHSQLFAAISLGVALLAGRAFLSTSPLGAHADAARSGVLGSCLATPTHWWPLTRLIKEYVHPTTNSADSTNAKIRIGTRLPLLDSALVTTVTVDSLCQIAAKKYGLYLYQDSLRIREITLLRLGDSAYAVGDIESRRGIDKVFLVLTPSWEWRGGSVAPLSWPVD